MNRSTEATTSTTVNAESYLTLHYMLSDASGEEYVSTFTLSPATIQMGSGQLAEPLEKCLVGLTQGQRRLFELTPDQAFGEHNPRLVERISRSALPLDAELRENSLIEFGTPDGGSFSGFLRELDATSALFDFNHPLAGKSLRFEVEIIGIL
jgi:FKBP-type peptidyl-prolyl cis-trans isomerase SlpA